MLNEMKKTLKIIQNVLKNQYIFLPEMYHHSVLLPFSLQLEVEAKKLFNNIVANLGVSIFKSVKVQNLENFISH
jgi:hypothetical protein